MVFMTALTTYFSALTGLNFNGPQYMKKLSKIVDHLYWLRSRDIHFPGYLYLTLFGPRTEVLGKLIKTLYGKMCRSR